MKGRKKGETGSWLEIYFLQCTCLQLFWPAIVMKKWLNIKPREDEFSADEKDTESEIDDDETSCVEKETASRNGGNHTVSRFQATGTPSETFLWRLKRGKSVTMRSQYIDTKELKILVGTWNVGGRLPPDDLDIEEWLDTKDPADVYVLGFQEVVPLNAGNIFGAEDNIPVLKWENLLRSTLNKTQPNKSKFKCYSAPPSPSRVNASDIIVDEILSENDVANEDVSILPHQRDTPVDVHAANDPIYPSNLYNVKKLSSNMGRKQATWPEELLNSELHHSKSNVNLRRVCSDSGRIKSGCTEPQETQALRSRAKLGRIYSMSEKISLSWPEQPLDLEAGDSLSSVSSFKNIHLNEELRNCLETFSVIGADAKSKNPKSVMAGYVRIVSKQMVGIFVSVWVRRSLRRHINNLKVSPIGVGVMGYIGNKGSVSVSLSIYQTSFCFVCSHLTSGERTGDELRRNSDVLEILRRTHFPSDSGIKLPQTILDHDRVVWFGDLNYRLNMSDDKTRELIAKKGWKELGNCDQLKKQLQKGLVFDGWFEGLINFPPTYKYEFNSNKYFGENSKAGEKRRTPAWCDRILTFGKGIRQLSYKRVEQKLSDHRPVNATFLVEVEIFCRRKLQRALTFTDAELEAEELPAETEDFPLLQQ
ncbi:type I inositol polyphosphate 5-phosphatase 1 isoform X2 [Cryptomeria japonica]|uniref:type I inositol polyphosphate 5-phosphatase 1 isoform X2 n=1 Tax=Cryptomeria japonica TaxID=3369 RepID=UPI0027D9F0F2|nr:type I inositol polyphosphate 5-phosphatase 1 isoform X2 [Cryptomeria japonica]